MAKWAFTVPEGYFDDCVTVATQMHSGRLTTRPLFALTPRSYPSDSDADNADGDDALDKRPWARFTKHVRALNRESPENVSYKIMFCTRHGQGYHNLKRQEVGDEAWNSYYSCLDDDDKMTWFDSRLTPLGESQVDALSAHWLASIAADGLPLPQRLYVSPLTRCLQTSQRLLAPVAAAYGLPYRPVVKEDLRSRWNMQSYTLRRTRTWIATNWPVCVIEDGFAEEDRRGMLPRVETDEEHEARSLKALGEVWEGDGSSEVIAWIFHSRGMQTLMSALGMEPFRVEPATTIALLVRGERSE